MSAVLPYFVASSEAVEFGPWMRATGNEWHPLGRVVPEWDYLTELHLQRTVRVHKAKLLESTGISDQAILRWSVSWRWADRRVARPCLVMPVECDIEQVIDVHIPGSEVGPSIELLTRIVLGEERMSYRPGTAHAVGSILCQDVCPIDLMGSRARFPVSIVYFENAHNLDALASCALSIDADYTAPVHGALELWINAADKELVAALQDASSDRARALVEQVHEYVVAAMLRRAVRDADELLSHGWEPESLGRILVELANRTQGELLGLKALHDKEPRAFESVLSGESRRNGLGRRFL